MSVEETQQAMSAYVEDLLGGGPYKMHFSEDVVVSLVGTDQGAEGPDGAEGWIDYLHKEAFEASPELRSMVVVDGQAAAEFDFVGRHVGEFGGMSATGRDVRVPYSAVYDLEGEKIGAVRIYLSTELLMQQLGGTPPLEENVNILRRGYEAFNRGDIDAVMGLMDPDIEWREPDVEGLPQRGTHHGPEAVARNVFGAIVGNWDGFRAVAEEFLDAGERVIVLGHFQGRGKTSGGTLNAPYAHVWTLREGKAVHFRAYADTANVLRSLG